MVRFVPRSTIAMLLAGAAALPACSDAGAPLAPDAAVRSGAAPTGEFVILGSAGVLPADLEARVSAAGGTLSGYIPEIGVAFATSADPAFEGRLETIAGVESVTGDLVMRWANPESRAGAGAEIAEETAAPPLPAAEARVASLADNEPFYAFQWAPAAVQAPEAWNAGYTGRGVRVAIVDGGLYANHIDLRANVDVAASRSFVAGTAFNQDVGTMWHGTHVAGIVAAADNGVGVIGIAPNATLIGVKVLHNGNGGFAGIVNGIVYAARPQAEGGAGADVINMSLGLTVDGKDKAIKEAVRELAKAVDRALAYAHQQGATLIIAAGNDGFSFDEEKTLVDIPGSSPWGITISSTAPLGWAKGATNFSRPASYTTYGKSLIDLAAPGGDFVLPGEDPCNVGGVVTACWVFDMYLSTVRGTTANGGYNWNVGTSMASPVAAGIAALIIEKNGGNMHPSQVEAALLQGAVDLDKPGKDEFYGHGFVNAFRSIQ